MFDDHFETAAAGTVTGPADGNDGFPPPFASDGLLAKIGLSIRAIHGLRSLPPGVGADG